jgi:tellurite resistance protein TerC
MDFLGGHSIAAWVGFNALILALLAVDLGVLHRKARTVGLREALVWNVIWVAVAMLFWGFVAAAYGRQAGLEYLTGYVIERALSIDNNFVFVVVFGYFAVPAAYQRRILYWGILGALIMRGVLILAGAAAVAAFHWVLYLFGAFLVWSGIQLLWAKESAPDPGKNPVVRLAVRFLPVTPELHGPRFLVRLAGRWHATPLFLVLIVVETTDLVFALDSIPAIFGITRDPFVIYTSNVFAILGLRAMYFLLAALLPHFRFLKHGLSLILVFVGARMLLDSVVQIPIAWTLGAVCLVLVLSVVASVILPRRPETAGGGSEAQT